MRPQTISLMAPGMSTELKKQDVQISGEWGQGFQMKSDNVKGSGATHVNLKGYVASESFIPPLTNCYHLLTCFLLAIQSIVGTFTSFGQLYWLKDEALNGRVCCRIRGGSHLSLKFWNDKEIVAFVSPISISVT